MRWKIDYSCSIAFGSIWSTNAESMDFLACLPGLNPIEHLGDALETEYSVKELGQCLVEVWTNNTRNNNNADRQHATKISDSHLIQTHVGICIIKHKITHEFYNIKENINVSYE